VGQVSVFLIFMIIVGVKLPLLITGYVIYKAVNDVPEPEIERDEGDFTRVQYEPGPRLRGPHGSGPARAQRVRKSSGGHKDPVAGPAGGRQPSTR